MKSLLTAVSILLLSQTLHASTESAYRGQQHRSIKALSQEDIDGYMTGKGMGFARAAELNHYPGPRHVLDNSEELKLSDKQLKQTQNLFNKMQAKAITLGKQLIEGEQKLDQLFAQGSVDRTSLETTLLDIGTIRTKLRNVHLSAHLEQKQLLTKRQIMMYGQLRGYGAGGSHSTNHNNSHNHSH